MRCALYISIYLSTDPPFKLSIIFFFKWSRGGGLNRFLEDGYYVNQSHRNGYYSSTDVV